ncbi:MAG TPA: tetratricopeptide repeat protein [Casimicrobiaceae bacterium]|nr:tetratricopeptide repeat protein [Casimicrobiaceae bacterium]
MSEGYTLREVGKLLGLPRSVVTGLIDAGFVAPTRGARREYRFTFQDLVVLRAAQALSDASIPTGRILRSLRKLRAKLPESMPLAGLRIEAQGDVVVVNEGQTRWRPDDGQYLLQFEVTSPAGRLVFIGPGQSQPPANEDWFDRAISLEGRAPEAACDAYRRAIDADPGNRDAYVNLGRLLHERARLGEAVTVYRSALDRFGADATLLFNLGVLHEDLGDPAAAIVNYRGALDVKSDFADAHFNLARLFEARGAQRDALRHWSAFRKLTK